MAIGGLAKAQRIQNNPTNRYIENAVTPFESAYRAIKSEDHRKLVSAYRNDVFSIARQLSQYVASAQLNLYAAVKTKSKLLNSSKSLTSAQVKSLAMSSRIGAHKIKSAEQVEEITQHPFLDLMQNVNPHFNSWDFIFLTNLYLELTGNAYWYLVKNKMGQIAEIWVLPSQNMWVVPDKNMFIKGYVMKSGGGVDDVPFEPDEVVHFKEPSPDNIYYGKSWVQAVAEAYNLQVNIDMHDVAFFSNMARPDGVLETEPDSIVHPDVYERTRQQFRQKYTGVRNMAVPIILEAGLKFQKIGHSPSDLGLKDSRRDILERLCRASGFPVGLALTENVNKSNAEIALVLLMRGAIKPRLTLIAEKINEKIMPLYDEKLFVAHENVIPADAEFQLKQEDIDINRGIRTRNEIRIARGLDPLPADIGDIVPPLPGENPLIGISAQPVKAIEGVKKKSTKDQRDAIWKAFDKRVKLLEGAFEKELKALFKAQRDEVLANLRKSKTIKADGDKLPPLDEITFNRNKWKKEFEKELKNNYQITIVSAGNAAESVLPELSFDAMNPKVQEFIGGKLGFMADSVNDTTLKAIEEQLSLAIENGESIPDMAQRIELVYEDAIGYRSTLIARTETISAYAEGSLQAYEQGGVDKVEWIATRDDRVRDEHLALDGKVIKMGDTWTFPESGVETRGPGLSGEPEHDCNCRCTTAPVIEEF